jgi:translocation and assembly module TamB
MQWKRTIGWVMAGLAILMLLAVVGGYIYLRSSGFKQFAIRRIVEQADQASGGRTEIGGLDFNLSRLTAHLYNITVRGTEAADQPPLLHADELTVRIKIVSALRRQVALRELLVDHPVVHFQVGQDGKNNLPAPPPSPNSGQTSVFDLAVEHVQLTNGEIYYNDRQTPLQADLFGLGGNVRFRPLLLRYEGTISYTKGNFQYAQYATLSHSLTLGFDASPDRLKVDSAVLKIGDSTMTVRAVLNNYSNLVADGDYQIRAHTHDFASMAQNASPTGDVELNGKFHYKQVAGQPFLRNLTIDGQVASDALSASQSGRRIDLRKIQGSYQFASGNLDVNRLTLATLGGTVIASAAIQHVDATPDSRIHVSLRNISLTAIQRTLRARAMEGAVLAGTIGGAGDATWIGSIDNLRAHADLAVQATASSRGASASSVPVNGAIHVSYSGADQVIEVRDTSLRIPSAILTAQGTVSQHSSLQVQVAAHDLHQLVALAPSFQSTQSQLPQVAGSATLNATVRGSMKIPSIAAELNAQNLQFEGSDWKSASLQIRANSSELTIEHGSLVNAQRGQATFSAVVGLRNWSYQPSSRIQAHLDAQQLSIAELQRVAHQSYPASGDLTAKLSLHGSQLDPNGSGSLEITNARAYGEPIQHLSAQFNAKNGTVSSKLNLSMAAGSAVADGFYTPKTKAYKVRLDAPAIVLQKLETVKAREASMVGTVSATLNGQGTLDDPQMDAVLQLQKMQIRENSISGVKAEVHVAQHFANLNLDSKVSEASIHAHGRIALSGDYETDAVIDTSTVPLDALMATYAPSGPQGVHGQTELHATLKGPLTDKSRLEAHLTIPVLDANYQSLKIGIASPIHADYADSVLTLQPAEIRGTGTSLRIQGKLPIGGNATPTLEANGSVDVRILKIVAPDVESSGTLALEVHASGSAASPQIQGQMQFKDISLTTADAPLGVEKLNGTVDITSDHLQVSKMTGQVGGGQVSVGGSIAYKPALQFNLALQGKSVRLRYPDGLRSVLDANLAFTGTKDESTLNGRVLIDSLSFTPDFDLSKLSDQFSSGNTLSQSGFSDTVKLAIGVQSQENLNATSSQISIAGRAALQVGGTAANPVITGRTTLTSGELFYRNVRYQLQQGVITFDNPNETHPVMNVAVTTTVEQYNLTLTLRGPLDKLTTSYVSDPPLATADVINLVARGKTTQESAASSQSTDSMIASQAAGQVSSSVQKLAGISSLQIDPTLGGNNQNPSARIAIQQRVTSNLLFTFSTDVSQPGSETVQGEYQLNKRWSVSMQRDQLGGVSIDGRFHKRF